MSKPLELTVYEYDEEGYGYVDPLGWIYPEYDVRAFIEQKRFTEGELCAEYYARETQAWMARAFGGKGHRSEQIERADAQADTFRRFATTPHYSDE